MRSGRAVIATALTLAACSHRAPPPAPSSPHYVVGSAYELGGVWSYPRESFRYDATGLAERLPGRTGQTTNGQTANGQTANGQTADGEAFDPAAMTGAHRTLQLPAIVAVTDLENGRQIRVRLNDRGPANPGRLLGLSARAADLLAMPASGAIQVRVELDSAASQELRDRLGGGPSGVTAAPVGDVVAETLPAPGQSRPQTPRVAVPTPRAPGLTEASDRLPETVAQTMPQPGALWLRAGQFSQSRYANSLKNKLSGLPVTIRREAGSRTQGYAVLAGPFASVASADAALDQARAAGLTDASIVVE